MESSKELATFGGGCFWCIEPAFRVLRGVSKVESGYAGGHAPKPTYEEVCEGTTGHAEVVQIEFDPSVISYRDLLEVFFTLHDPTTKDRQGNDVGPQYRSVVLYHSEAQREEAERVIADLEREGVFGRSIVTELAPLDVFHVAEPYHQRYYERNPRQGYCQVVIAPKIAKFRKKYAELLA